MIAKIVELFVPLGIGLSCAVVSCKNRRRISKKKLLSVYKQLVVNC